MTLQSLVTVPQSATHPSNFIPSVSLIPFQLLFTLADTKMTSYLQRKRNDDYDIVSRSNHLSPPFPP